MAANTTELEQQAQVLKSMIAWFEVKNTASTQKKKKRKNKKNKKANYVLLAKHPNKIYF